MFFRYRFSVLASPRLASFGVMLLTAWLIVASAAVAGGPENVILVVNAESSSSKLMANHYIAGRQIPERNVIYLADIPQREVIDLKTFRETILKPVFDQMEQRQLLRNTDYIVYSSDFPTAVNVQPHLDKLLDETLKENAPDLDRRLLNPVASINALTFYASAVLSDQPAYMLLNSNHYYRHAASKLLRQPFLGQRQQEFEQAVEQLEAGEPEALQQAINTLSDMANKNRGQLAVAYMLARAYGRQGKAREAAQWLGRAARQGWCYRKQTLADKLFEPVLEDPLFAGIVEKIPDQPFDYIPTRGFRSLYPFGPNGMINSESGQGNRHFLSTVLAVTRNQGNHEREALEQLLRTMRADGSLPQGTFYFTKTNDVRTTTRAPQFDSAIDSLESLGYQAKVVESKMPSFADDVLGLTSGTASFKWLPTGNKFVPGAIADNLTSFGGRMNRPGQTKLTEFLAYGAAGASGTVVEPYAIQAKFPHPMIHVHYARGATLAEAYYQSVEGPMQLLIVGDALCRPFAEEPSVKISGVTSGQTVSGEMQLELDASESAQAISGVQLFVDGRLVHQQSGTATIKIDTAGLSDGYHELRVVPVGRSLLEVTGRQIVPIRVDNHGHQVVLECTAQRPRVSETIKLTATSNYGDTISLFHNGREIARQNGREVSFEIDGWVLGRGPVRLEAVATQREGGDQATPQNQSSAEMVSSGPIDLEVEGRLLLTKPKTADGE